MNEDKIKGMGDLKISLKNIQKSLKSANGVNVGFFEDDIYPDGTPVSEIASTQEFGATINHEGKTIVTPPRPFLRPTVADQSDWADILNKALTEKNFSMNRALKALGKEIKKDIRLHINAVKTPPLSAATIARKGGKKPLVDTGFMRSSISYKIVKDDGEGEKEGGE